MLRPMNLTEPCRLLRFVLAAPAGLVAVATCLAQAMQPSLRLGSPVPPAAAVPTMQAPGTPPQQNVPPPAQPAPPPVTLAPPVTAPIPPPLNDVPAPIVPAPGQVVVPGATLDPRPARVGEILIFGQQVTKDYVIRRQIPLQPGQILSFPDLRLAEHNLAGLGIFVVDPLTGVHPTVTADPESPNDFKNILVHVQEAPTTSFMFGVSVNSDTILNGSLVFNERNFDITGWPSSFDEFRTGRAFRGAGEELRVEATPGTAEQRYIVTFREPYLLDSLFSLTASGYYYQNAYHDQYTESRLGGRVTIARRLDPNWSVEGTVRLEDVGVHHIPFGAPPQITVDQGDHFLAGFRAGVTYDTRDSIFRPTEGFMANLSFEEGTGDFTFPKAILDFDKYWTLHQRPDGSGRQVLALRSELGIAGSNTPVFERFYAGGFRSLRGFAFRGVGPSALGIEVGGDFEFLNRLEYQAPLLANDHLYGVAFFDTGTVESSVELRNYRIAAGAGLRIQVPQLGPLPLALDFGFPIVKANGDHTQLFSFWIGFIH